MISVSKRSSMVVCILVLAAITAAAFLPCLSNQFVDWDDPIYVVNNELIREISLENMKEIFTGNFLGHYCPLVMVSYALEYRFFELDPFIYHFTNYMFNIFIALLVFWFIYLLSRKQLIAFMGAALFAVHPLHVENVAWVMERKDMLCVFFYVLALIVYLLYARGGKLRNYLLCLVFVVLALLSKVLAVTLPVVFILLDYFEGRKINVKTLVEKIPFFLIAGVFGVINIMFEVQVNAMESGRTLIVRSYFLSRAILFYLYKLVIPVNLSAMYPYYPVTSANMIHIGYFTVGLVLLAVAVVSSARYTKKVIFGSLFFLITILPTLQIVPAGGASAADRYMYLPSIGIAYMLAVLAAYIVTRLSSFKAAKVFVYAVVTAIVITLSLLTWQRCKVWKDTGTLFTDVVKQYPYIPIAYNKLGAHYARSGDYDRGIYYFKIVLTMLPDYDKAQGNIQQVYKDKRAAMVREGLITQEEAAEQEKVNILAVTYNDIGVRHGSGGDLNGAIFFFGKAVEVDPDYPESYNNLGFAYFQAGDIDRSEAYFKKTLEFDPEHQNAIKNLDIIRKIKDQSSD
ncbi:MAG: tetratricopeptide repeat protein [Candidatus Tantalella remota]|nr:tetratricopeptide repeat protein [Candidatus Tantalella remota]